MASPADRKIPGVFSIVLGSFLSLTLGVLLASLHLVSRPVEVVKTAPKEAKEGTRYFIQGAPGGGGGKSWQRKRESLVQGYAGDFSLTEPELNAWSEATFEPAKLEEGQAQPPLMIVAGVPNFRIEGTALQVGLVNTLHLFGTQTPLVLQARGGFEKSGSGWRFAPSEAYLGDLPLHKMPALLPVVAARFGANQAPAEVGKMLAGADQISVRDGALLVSLP